MRALALIATILATVPLGFVAPYAGVLVWCWLSFLNPQQLIFLPGLPVVYAAAVITAIGLVASPEPKRLPQNLLPWVVLLFMFWMTLTSFFALDPTGAWEAWTREIKTFVLALVIMIVMTNRVRLHALIWVIVLSVAYFSLKGGVFVLLTGGGSHVQGTGGTATGDNNNLGLIMVMSWPLINYLRLNSANRLVRLGLAALMGFTILAVLGTYSRGAFLALFGVLSYFWWKAKQKVVIGIIGIVAVVPAVLFMPPQWLDRMHSIETYNSDASAVGRLEEWGFAIKLASDRPLVGGGFNASQSPAVLRNYYSGQRLLAFHSIWFQSLGDHGFPGLLLFIAIALVGWHNASVIRRATRSRPDMAWANDLATMCQVSLAGYFLGGSFLSMAYYDCYYAIIAVLAVLRDIVSRPSVALATTLHPDAVTVTASLASEFAAAEKQLPTKGA